MGRALRKSAPRKPRAKSARNAPPKETPRAKEQKRDREATRAALLAAGEKLFAENSFEGATFDAIAEEAGVNKALIAYYFGSKEGLHDAVIETLVREVLADIGARMGPETADPAKNFAAYIGALAGALWDRPSMPAILMREYLSGSMLDRKSPFANIAQFYRTTERLYEAGRKAKIFRTLDPRILHLSIVGPIVHFVVAADARKRTIGIVATGLSNPPIATFAAGLQRIVIDGLRRGE